MGREEGRAEARKYLEVAREAPSCGGDERALGVKGDARLPPPPFNASPPLLQTEQRARARAWIQSIETASCETRANAQAALAARKRSLPF
jgi:hypothetical protein